MSDDLAKQLRMDAEAYRQSLAAPTSHDMFTLAYQWQDKKHRHVWDLCSRLETAAGRIEKLEAALKRIADLTERWEHDLVSQVNEIARKALGATDG